MYFLNSVFIVIIILFVVGGTVVDCIFLRQSHTITDNNYNSKYSVVNGHNVAIGRLSGAKTAGSGSTDEDVKTKEKVRLRTAWDEEPKCRVSLCICYVHLSLASFVFVCLSVSPDLFGSV